MRLNHRSAPLRFIVGLLAGWTGLRIVPLLLPGDAPPILSPIPMAPHIAAHRPVGTPIRWGQTMAAVSVPLAAPPRSAGRAHPAPGFAQPIRARANGRPDDEAWRDPGDQLALAAYYASRPGRVIPAAYVRLLPDRPAPPPFLPPPPAADGPSRWSGWAYAFLRQGSGARSLAPGQAQLGGSQAAARLAYRLSPALSAAARVSTAVEDRAGEGAVGVEWRPLPAVRFALERRVALDRGGRSAWSAYAAGGFTRQRGSVTLDGSAQAGVVGARAQDLFADGALRVGHRIGPVQVGGGIWAAAQPGAARIDVGPRLAARLGESPLTLSLERRFRVAGDARPGSGVALTLGADF